MVRGVDAARRGCDRAGDFVRVIGKRGVAIVPHRPSRTAPSSSKEWRDPRRCEHETGPALALRRTQCGRIRSFAATRSSRMRTISLPKLSGRHVVPAPGSRDSGLRRVDAVRPYRWGERNRSRSQTPPDRFSRCEDYELWDRGDEPMRHESEPLSLLTIHRACHGVPPSTGSSERHAPRNSCVERTPSRELRAVYGMQPCRHRLGVTPVGQSRNQRYDRIQVTRSDSSVVGTADLVDEQ